MTNINKIEKFLNKSGEPKCFMIATNKGCRIEGKYNEVLALFTCLFDELKNDIDKKDFIKALEIAYEEDKEIEKLKESINEVREMLDDIDKMFEED